MENNELLQKIEILEKKMADMENSRGLRAFMRRVFSKSSFIIGVAAAAALTGFLAWAAQNTFVDGTVISADAVNNNFTELYKTNVPVGGIIAWHKNGIDGTAAPVLPANFVECNGQILDDAGSIWNGKVIPDLNSAERFLRGGTTSGTYQDDATAPNGLSIVSGGSHAHAITYYAFLDDHNHSTEYIGNADNMLYSRTQYTSSDGAHTHGLNGDSETRPVNMSIVWIMRIK